MSNFWTGFSMTLGAFFGGAVCLWLIIVAFFIYDKVTHWLKWRHRTLRSTHVRMLNYK